MHGCAKQGILRLCALESPPACTLPCMNHVRWGYSFYLQALYTSRIFYRDACAPTFRVTRNEPSHIMPSMPLGCLLYATLQEFFYHVLLVLDSHIFNSHMKAELAAEIARLYQQQSAFKDSRKGVAFVKDGDEQCSRGNAAAGEGVRGFTGTMVKLKVGRTEFCHICSSKYKVLLLARLRRTIPTRIR